MHMVDIAIIGIIALSIVISLFRGFIKEAISLATWILAIWLAWFFHADLAVHLEAYIATPSLRLASGFGLLFVATLIVGAFVNFVIGRVVEATGLTGTDRVLGAVFGAFRGILIIAVLVLLAGLTPLPQDGWWHESFFIEYFQGLAVWMRDFLPSDISKNFIYGS